MKTLDNHTNITIGEAHAFNIADTSKIDNEYYLHDIKNIRKYLNFRGRCSSESCHNSVTCGAHVFIVDDNNDGGPAVIPLCNKCNHHTKIKDPFRLKNNTKYCRII